MTKVAKSILIVEDDERLSRNEEYFFSLNGFNVKAVFNGLEALEFLMEARPNLPDMIILDIMMPEMDGLELLDRMKKDETLKDVPVVAFSALPAKDYEEQLISAGCLAYIEKFSPMNKLLKVLIKTVTDLMDEQSEQAVQV